MMRLLLSLCALFWLGATQAAVDTYEFSSDSDRQRYRTLIAELRCPKCQNQNLADSNAPIATDLRQEVYRMVGEGKADADIVEHLVLRYGDFVRYKPPLDQRTWLLWFGPFALLLLGAVIMLAIVRRRRSSTRDSAGLSTDEQSRLAHLLDKKDS